MHAMGKAIKSKMNSPVLFLFESFSLSTRCKPRSLLSTTKFSSKTVSKLFQLRKKCFSFGMAKHKVANLFQLDINVIQAQ